MTDALHSWIWWTWWEVLRFNLSIQTRLETLGNSLQITGKNTTINLIKILLHAQQRISEVNITNIFSLVSTAYLKRFPWQTQIRSCQLSVSSVQSLDHILSASSSEIWSSVSQKQFSTPRKGWMMMMMMMMFLMTFLLCFKSLYTCHSSTTEPENITGLSFVCTSTPQLDISPWTHLTSTFVYINIDIWHTLICWLGWI